MDSVVSICNSALRLIKANVINSLKEASDQARACAEVYDGARRALLREFVWNFARSMTVLSLSAGWKGDALWRYAYVLPEACLYAVRVFSAARLARDAAPGSGFANDERFELGLLEEVRNEGLKSSVRVVFTDAEQACLEYVSDVTETKLFDPMFAETLVYKLASQLAVPLSGSPEAGQYYARLAETSLAKARLACANEGRRRRLTQAARFVSGFEAARRRG